MCLEKNLPQYHFILHKFQIDYPQTEPESPPMINRLSHGTAQIIYYTDRVVK
jgi:hypothetical protein